MLLLYNVLVKCSKPQFSCNYEENEASEITTQ